MMTMMMMLMVVVVIVIMIFILDCMHKYLVQEYCIAMAPLLNEGVKGVQRRHFWSVKIRASILVILKVFPKGRRKV